MYSPVFYIAAAVGIAGLASAGQVNFYSDGNCQNYLGSREVPSFQTTGGPAGSFSAMWISRDQQTCSRTCGPLIICGDSNCNTRKAVGQWPSANACHGFNTGVWVRNGCGSDMCGNA